MRSMPSSRMLSGMLGANSFSLASDVIFLMFFTEAISANLICGPVHPRLDITPERIVLS